MSGYGNSRHARRTKPMSNEALLCAEELVLAFDVRTREGRSRPSVYEIAKLIDRTLSSPEAGCTYQKDTETNSLRMIDEGRDV